MSNPARSAQGDGNTSRLKAQTTVSTDWLGPTHVSSTKDASGMHVGGVIDLESRLADHVSLAPDARAYLPAGLSDYEVAVCTGFPNFEYRSRHELLEQSYAALRTGNPGEGVQAGPTENYIAQSTRTIGDYEYQFTHDTEVYPFQFRGVSVGRSGRPERALEAYVERPEELGVSCHRRLTVKLQGFGEYEFVRTHTIHEVTIKSKWGRQMFRYIHWVGHDGSRDVWEGAIPPWQGSNGQAR